MDLHHTIQLLELTDGLAPEQREFVEGLSNLANSGRVVALSNDQRDQLHSIYRSHYQ